MERRLRNEQLQWATTELIPHLADLLNNQKIVVVYASELLDELRARGFHVRFLGALRATTRDRRSRSLLLVVMVRERERERERERDVRVACVRLSQRCAHRCVM